MLALLLFSDLFGSKDFACLVNALSFISDKGLQPDCADRCELCGKAPLPFKHDLSFNFFNFILTGFVSASSLL